MALVPLASAALTQRGAADQAKPGFTLRCDIVQNERANLSNAESVAIAALGRCTTDFPGNPLDGAKDLMTESLVLDKSKGLDHGTISFLTDHGSLTSAFWGDARLTGEGASHTQTSGNFKVTIGTGLFAGATGQGTYSAEFDTPTHFVARYTGQIKLKAPTP
jgi:hypothetical protein